MFGNNKTSEELPSMNGKAQSTSNISNRINVGTTITGEIESDGDIRIEGTIRGTLKTRAKVAIGNTGLIEGDIYCKTADIEGKVAGDIEVTELLTLKSTSTVEGNIYTNKIVIENGAQFNGICSMGLKEQAKTQELKIEKPAKEAIYEKYFEE